MTVSNSAPRKNVIVEQKFTVIKCKLKTVLKYYDKLQPIIDAEVIDANVICINGLQLLKDYLINIIEKNTEFPNNIDYKYILKFLTVVCQRNNAQGPKRDSTDIDIFYKNNFVKLIPIERPNLDLKSFMLTQMAMKILTCLETNISTNFISYVNKYVNIVFAKELEDHFKDEVTNINDNIKDPELRKSELNKIKYQKRVLLRDLKLDIFNGSISKSDKMFHKWFNENRSKLVPLKINKHIAYHLKADPIAYLKYALYINAQIEKLDRRPYQVIPQRTSVIPKYVLFNTKAMASIVHTPIADKFKQNKQAYIKETSLNKDEFWDTILNMNNKIFRNKKKKGFVFNGEFMTDGLYCSLTFIREKYKNETFGKKTKCKNPEIKFNQLEELTKEQCDKYLNGNYKKAGLDPGKTKPITMVDEDGNVYMYSAVRRQYEIYLQHSNYIIKKEKDESIKKEETALSEYSCRTLNPEKNKEYIEAKNKANEKIKGFYQQPLLRNLRFRRYTRKKQSEMNMLNEIERTFLTEEEIESGKKLLIFYGDYDRRTHMPGTIPVPSIGIRKLIASRFDILITNEFRTSKLLNETKEELTNVTIRKNGHTKRLHQVLTPKEEPYRICVNRDVNASKNILEIGEYYLQNQQRPKEFTRTEVKKEGKKKKTRTVKQKWIVNDSKNTIKV